MYQLANICSITTNVGENILLIFNSYPVALAATDAWPEGCAPNVKPVLILHVLSILIKHGGSREVSLEEKSHLLVQLRFLWY